MKVRVSVWGKQIEIDGYQTSKSVWHASGQYLGLAIRTKDRADSTAAKRWPEAAKYHGN